MTHFERYHSSSSRHSRLLRRTSAPPAQVVAFLVSDESDFTVNSELIIDYGMSTL
jgi:hypothetical protein